MPGIQETAYPRLRSQVSPRELAEIYTPTGEELALSRGATRGAVAQLGFLILLRTFQRLGYFVPLSDVPVSIIAHLALCAGIKHTGTELSGYDFSGTARRHRQVIRERLGVQPYDRTARRLMVEAMSRAARTKDEPADLINVAIEELIRRQWELPAFSALRRAALHVRAAVHRAYYREIARALDGAALQRVNALWQTDPATRHSPWNELKQSPGSASLGHFRDLVTHYQWLEQQSAGVRAALSGVPDIKVKHFAAEARSLDAARLQALAPPKRYALAASLLDTQTAQSLDDLAEMFVKRMRRIHQRGQEALARHREQEQERTDQLIGTLRELVTAYCSEGTTQQRLAAIGQDSLEMARKCSLRCHASITETSTAGRARQGVKDLAATIAGLQGLALSICSSAACPI